MYVIEATSGTPIYRQIIDQVTRQVASGQLRRGDPLPSIRKVAEELAINPMTVSKAYVQLEHDGVLRRCRGVGMVIADKHRLLNRATLIGASIENLVTQAKQLELSVDQLLELIEEEWRKQT